MSVTASLLKQIEAEVEKAIKDNAETLNENNCEKVFSYRQVKSTISWRKKYCPQSKRPKIVHENPWSEKCALEVITQQLKAEYIDLLENHKRIEQTAVGALTRREKRTTRTPGVNKHQDKFCQRSEETTWEEDKTDNPYYHEEAKQEDEYT